MAILSLVEQPTARPTMASGSTILKRGFIEVLLQHEAPTVGNDPLWFQADSRTGVRTRAGLPILCTSRRLVTGASFGGNGKWGISSGSSSRRRSAADFDWRRTFAP